MHYCQIHYPPYVKRRLERNAADRQKAKEAMVRDLQRTSMARVLVENMADDVLAKASRAIKMNKHVTITYRGKNVTVKIQT